MTFASAWVWVPAAVVTLSFGLALLVGRGVRIADDAQLGEIQIEAPPADLPSGVDLTMEISPSANRIALLQLAVMRAADYDDQLADRMWAPFLRGEFRASTIWYGTDIYEWMRAAESDARRVRSWVEAEPRG